ncbi:cysteine--tRNA ligase [Stappia stellulata]|uniref:cysteine--tRNA ligase n=1 Tax=Stappia stellulata TaxID=71235 RepID=UPI0004170C36|nr:cysteine--tRNA ligase [Stappia stellulata]
MHSQHPLKLTNTLTRSKDIFVPEDPSNVRMYVCGPTVYDFAHIGNARPVIVFDVLYRLLRHLYGMEHVTYVRNITDVDDKINARALRDYPDLPLNDAIARVTQKTADQFHADVKALGCLAPSVEPRATQHIPGMIAMIETLIAKGNAYVAEGEVLFDVASMPAYGGLSRRNLEDQKAGARIAVEGHKKNPGDFVLWKLSSDEEPGWDSPWGRGRPGWHIECSVMSEAHLGATFDIHGGGLDLIFPHHENEIAQSCCAHDTDRMASVWLHNGFVQVEGKKMSKSEGNFVTIHDLLASEKFGGRKWPGEVLRLAMLMTHYREPIDFSVKRLEEAERRLAGWRRVFEDKTLVSVEAKHSERFIGKLADDLNTPEALNLLTVFAGYARGTGAEYQRGGEAASDNPSPELAAAWLKGSAELLGLSMEPQNKVSAAHQKRVDERLEVLREADVAKLAGDKDLMKQKFIEADSIREELDKAGIQLKDGKDPETGMRVTTCEVRP